jgi:DNA-binding MarR family transcriptional regulator
MLHELVSTHRGWFMGVCSDFDLAPGQLMALKWLDPESPVPMRELAHALACDNSNVTGIVDRLEERGLVCRRPCENDRRVKLLCITPEGMELRTRVKQRLQEPPAALQRLSPAEQRQLRDLLLKALGRD